MPLRARVSRAAPGVSGPGRGWRSIAGAEHLAVRRDFDLCALYDALDAERRSRGLTWAAVTDQVNGGHRAPRSIAQSTVTGLKDRQIAEGDGILQMLLWLGRTPESFVPGVADADAERFRLPKPAPGHVLRWDTKALHTALNAKRRDRGLTWAALAREVGGFSPGMLTSLSRNQRVALPRVMRLALWLDQPAVTFTRIADR